MSGREFNVNSFVCLLFSCWVVFKVCWDMYAQRKPVAHLGVPANDTTKDPSVKLYVVTPTYRRAVQIPELIRLSQTLSLVDNLHWIVVEDSSSLTPKVAGILEESGISFSHLLGPRPAAYSNVWKFGRGVSNRLRALQWLRENATLPAVLYFADDDNAYDVRLFEEIRRTKMVSVFPVGLILGLGISSPIVHDGKVVGFHDPSGGRTFMLDMAGFAVNINLIQRENAAANISYRASLLEDSFLKSIGVTVSDLQPLAKNCTEVLVWHTQTFAPFPGNTPQPIHKDKYPLSNLGQVANDLRF